MVLLAIVAAALGSGVVALGSGVVLAIVAAAVGSGVVQLVVAAAPVIVV